MSYDGRDQVVAFNFQRQLWSFMNMVVATISDVNWTLEQTDIISSTWNASVNVTNATLIYICYLFIGNCLLSPCRARKTASLPYTKAISAS